MTADTPVVFDRALLARRRARAEETLAEADFLEAEAAGSLAGRLMAVNRRFPLAIDLGAQTGRLSTEIVATGKVDRLIATESCLPLAARLSGTVAACDEEALAFADSSLDLVVSGLALHWVNDLPGTLIQIRRALKPDGLFLAALLGGETLAELRHALMEAEAELTGGASPRVAPFVDLRDGGALLQRAGFALPVADSDVLTVRYDTALGLLRDLRRLGWTNAMTARSRSPLRREVLTRALAIYGERAGDADGRVRATFEIVYLSGWAPHESQQQPLRPGSARTRLADALGVTEHPTGDKTPFPRRDPGS